MICFLTLNIEFFNNWQRLSIYYNVSQNGVLKYYNIELIKENIKKILAEGYPVLRDGAITYVLGEDMTSTELNNILSKRIEPMATKEAKAKIFGVDYSEMEKDELKAELTELEKEYWGLNDN